jgi:hypothetical protein
MARPIEKTIILRPYPISLEKIPETRHLKKEINSFQLCPPLYRGFLIGDDKRSPISLVKEMDNVPKVPFRPQGAIHAIFGRTR